MKTPNLLIVIAYASLSPALLSAQGDPCSVPGVDDAFEENDDCTSPVLMAPGLYLDLLVRDDDFDYYEVVLQPGERIDVRDPDQAGPRFALLDANCTLLDGPSNFVDYTNASQVVETVIVEAKPQTGIACRTYDMLIDVAPNPCVMPPEGDSCTNPSLVEPFYNVPFTVSSWDDDYFAFCVPAGGTAFVAMTYPDFLGHGIFLDLYEWDGTCSNVIGTSDLLCCTTETATYTNSSSSNQYVVARISFTSLGSDCGSYDLTIDVTGGTCSAPAVYCSGKLSSAGCVPQIVIDGVPSASIPTPFQIDATDVVNFKNGIVFYGFNGPTSLPFLGGTLCVTPPLRRAPLQNSGGSPPNQSDCSGAYAFDFNAWIQSGSDPFLGAGVDVNAQYWFRDPPSSGGAGLTNATQFTIAL